jgi:hypothetical protein
MTSKTFFVFGLFLSLGLSVIQAQTTPDRHGCGYSRMDAINIAQASVPLYPLLAVQARISGTVKIRVLVQGGAITSADVIESDNPVLAAAAKENLQTWRFAEHGYGDFCVTYDYVLGKIEMPSPTNPKVEMDFPSRVRITTSPMESALLHQKSGGGEE